MSWTKVAKPSGLAWTNTNPQGKEQYDQANLTYDDLGVFYNSTALGAWTSVAKPGFFGAELVANGSFAGSAAGWSLGDGWSYSANKALFTLLGPEMVTNGSFDGSAAGWTLNAGWSYASNHVSTDGTSSTFFQLITFDGAKTYKIDYELANSNNQLLNILVLGGAQTNLINYGVTNSNGPKTIYGTGPNFSTTQNFGFAPDSSTPFIGDMDSISIHQYNKGALAQNITPFMAGERYRLVMQAQGTGVLNVKMGVSGLIPPVINPTGTILTYDFTAAGGTQVAFESDHGIGNEFEGTVTNVSVMKFLQGWTNVPKPV